MRPLGGGGGGGGVKRCLFDFLDFPKRTSFQKNSFIKHLSLRKGAFSQNYLTFSKHTISLNPFESSDISRTSEGRGPGGPARGEAETARPHARPHAWPHARPRTRPGLIFFRCAMVETPAVRRNAPVSSAANPHNVLGNYNQPSSH
jgi:hypothetical protein